MKFDKKNPTHVEARQIIADKDWRAVAALIDDAYKGSDAIRALENVQRAIRGVVDPDLCP